MGTNQKLSNQIIEGVGGAENVNGLIHCVTRLRFYLNDTEKVNEEQLNSLSEVMGTRYQGGQYQVVIGPNVKAVYEEIQNNFHFTEKQDASNLPETEEKQNWLNKLMGTIGGIFTPIMGALAGAGMLKGLLIAFTFLNVFSPKDETYQVLNIIADAAFYFLPFLLAVSAARRFKTNEYIALSIAGALFYPTILNAATSGTINQLHFFGIPLRVVNYSSSVIPIILGVWALSYLMPFIDKLIPSALKMIVTPLVTLFVVVPITLIVLGPIGSYLGVWVGAGIKWLFDAAPFAAGIVLGASRPILVITGMHYAITPVILQNIHDLGYDFINPVNFMSTMSQTGAVLATFFLLKKNKKMKALAASSTISGFLGITEPALYGVLVELKRPLVGALIGGGIAGGFVAWLGGRAYALVMPSIVSLPIYFGPKFIVVIIGAVIAFILGFVITWALGIDKKYDVATDLAPANPPKATKVVINSAKEQKQSNTSNLIYSPLEGEVYALSEVSDDVFSSELMGQGIAIRPTNTQVKSPVSGKVTMVFETSHAIGLTSDSGIELLIHLGLDTVNLKGQGFEVLVAEGQEVSLGEPLINFDRQMMLDKGFDLITPIVITNTGMYKEITPKITLHTTVTVTDILLEVQQ